MPIPSGSGSEVLKGLGAAYTSTATHNTLTAGANEIITILSVVVAEVDNVTTNSISLKVDSEYLIYNQSLPGSGTFIWNDKIVIQAGDVFHIRTHASNTVHCYVSYIVQDWT